MQDTTRNEASPPLQPERRHLPIVIPFSDRETWMELRRTTVGASEVAALFSIEPDESDEEDWEDERAEPASPYQTPLSLFALKKGLIRPKETVDDRIYWGSVLEPLVAEKICERRGWALRRPEGYMIHPRERGMGCTLDFEIDPDGTQEWCPLEIKCVSGLETWKWKNALGDWVLPEWIHFQVQQQMEVTGHHRAFVGVLFGGNDDRVFEIERCPETCAALLKAIADFQRSLEANEEPEPDYERDAQVLARIRLEIDPKGDLLDWTEDNEAQELLARYQHHSAEARKHEKAKTEARAHLLTRIGTAPGAIFGEKTLGTHIVKAGQVNYWRDAMRNFSFRKTKTQHAGSSVEQLTRTG